MVFIKFLKNLSTQEHKQQLLEGKLSKYNTKFTKGQTNRIQERNLVLFSTLSLSGYLNRQKSCVLKKWKWHPSTSTSKRLDKRLSKSFRELKMFLNFHSMSLRGDDEFPTMTEPSLASSLDFHVSDRELSIIEPRWHLSLKPKLESWVY